MLQFTGKLLGQERYGNKGILQTNYNRETVQTATTNLHRIVKFHSRKAVIFLQKRFGTRAFVSSSLAGVRGLFSSSFRAENQL
jgi:hypothetical protein